MGGWAGVCWGGGADYKDHGASVPLRLEVRVLRLATQPPALLLSLHVTALSNPLFDNYLLCCLGRG